MDVSPREVALAGKFTKIWKIFADAFEVYLAATCFAVMFFAFILQIFTRYIMGYQVGWTYEATVIGFMWVVAFGGSYASRLREHVAFSMIYDKMSVRGRALTEIISNIAIIIGFIILFMPALSFIDFMKIKKTAVMKVPISVLYAPFIYFIVSSTVYVVRDTYKAFRTLMSENNNKGQLL